MEEYLKRVALSKKSPEEFGRDLESESEVDAMARLVADLLINQKAKRQAEVWIEYYLGEFEAGSRDQATFLDDPLFINRMILAIRAMLAFVPIRQWRKVRKVLLRMERIAAETNEIRQRIALAHAQNPGMANQTWPATADTLIFPH